jgi:membrane protein required for colicin V production
MLRRQSLITVNQPQAFPDCSSQGTGKKLYLATSLSAWGTHEGELAMQAYDILMLVVLVVATVRGLWKGLAWQVASLGSIVLSYFVAIQFRAPLAEYIDASPPWNKFLAMLVLFLLTSLLVWTLFRFVRAFIDRVKLKEFDHQIGALLGAAKGVLLCIIITLFTVALASESQRESVIGSRSGYYIAHLLNRAHGIMPREIHDVLHPYLHSLEDSLDHEHNPHEEAS